MKKLKELLSKINPNELSPREQQLLTASLKENWEKEETLAEEIWPGDTHQRKYYREVKAKLVNRVINLVLDEDSKSPYAAKMIEAYKMFSAVQILGSIGKKEAYIYFAERLLKISLKYEITDIAASIANSLYYHAGVIEGQQAQANKYLAIAKEQDQLLIAEREVKRIFVHVAMDFSNSRTGRKNTLEKINRFLDSRNIISANSYRYLYFYNYLLAIDAHLRKDAISLDYICIQTLSAFQQKKYTIPHSVYFLFGFQLRAQLALEVRDYQMAQKAIAWAQNIVNDQEHNQSTCLLYQATIAFHLKDYQMLCDAILISDTIGEKLSTSHRQSWIIIKAYAHLFDVIPDQTFRLSKFYNQVGKVASDKSGMNLSIILIEILYQLKHKKFGELIDRVEAIDKYARRYLRGINERGDCIINMLLTIVKNDFQKKESHSAAKEYWVKLKSFRTISDSEIVPYEMIWNEALLFLQDQTTPSKQ